MQHDILRPKIEQPLTLPFAFWLPALFAAVIGVSAHEETLDQYPVFAYMVHLTGMLVPSVQGWQQMEGVSQRGLLLAAWSWISIVWLLAIMLPRYIRWRCKPERFEMVAREEAFGSRAQLYKGSGSISNVLMPYIICFVAATFLVYSYESASFYSATSYAECQRLCSMEWLYFCLGMLFFSYVIPLLILLFIYITLDLKALITQKLP